MWTLAAVPIQSWVSADEAIMKTAKFLLYQMILRDPYATVSPDCTTQINLHNQGQGTGMCKSFVFLPAWSQRVTSTHSPCARPLGQVTVVHRDSGKIQSQFGQWAS